MIKHKAVIVGAGFAGLCMAIKLKQAGIHEFVILEKASGLGGTWRENTYPGAECDIPSALYSYSFEHNADWQFKWSGQKQILKYQQDTAAKYKLGPHCLFNETVVSAEYQTGNRQWLIKTQSGYCCLAQHFICAVGQLHYPSTPCITGANQYQGHSFHSAHWNHSINLADKRIGVIGNAASAVQFIPEIARVAKQITVFQRSANWVLPKLDRPYAKWEQRLSAKLPWVTRFYRWWLWALGEYGVLSAINGNRVIKWLIRSMSLRHLRNTISDVDLRAKLTPDYPIGAKRILFSDHYYATLAKPQVSLSTSKITRITEQGIVTDDGQEHCFDVVIYATGFKTNPSLAKLDIHGTTQTIRDAWRNGAHAYLGVATHGFPNLHLLYGPNTNLGHTSVIIMHEAQANYIVRAIEYLDRHGHAALDIARDVEQRFNDDLQARLASTAFTQVTNSWYMDGQRITNNWPGGTREYLRRLNKVDWRRYLFT